MGGPKGNGGAIKISHEKASNRTEEAVFLSTLVTDPELNVKKNRCNRAARQQSSGKVIWAISPGICVAGEERRSCDCQKQATSSKSQRRGKLGEPV